MEAYSVRPTYSYGDLLRRAYLLLWIPAPPPALTSLALTLRAARIASKGLRASVR